MNEVKRTRVVTAAVVVGLLVAGSVFRHRLVAWFDGSSAGGSTSASAHVAAGGLSVDTTLQPDPPKVNGNHAHVTVRDAQGKAVVGAKVRLEFDMPAMGAMQAMHGGADASDAGDGHYTIPFDLAMDGSWTVSIHVTSAAGAATVRYTLRVGAPGLIVLGGEAAGSAGTCPTCAMNQPPGTRGPQPAGVIHIEEDRRALLGIRTTKVVTAPIDLEIVAQGRLAIDETRLHDITLRVSGYISDLHVNATGQTIHKGDPLFTLYSPELYAAEQEYLIARSNRDLAGMAGHGDALMHASELKLRLWGLTDTQLRAITDKNAPIERLPFFATASGVVIENNVVGGAAVTAGQRLFRIADLDQIWVEADVYEADLRWIKQGMAASIALTFLPGRAFDGKVELVYPYLDPRSRTGRVRIALPNRNKELKPDMFATVTFKLPLGPKLLVPISAVVYTGPRRLVFLDLGHGALRPQEVTLGARSGDLVEIVSGVTDGDLVVSSGNFLVAAESRVRSVGSMWEATDVQH